LVLLSQYDAGHPGPRPVTWAKRSNSRWITSANHSPDPDNEYFVDGLTEEIIADLSRLEGLRVISRNSAMTLKGTRKDTPTIARGLKVSHVVAGSVRRAGIALRVTTELVDASNDEPIWSEKYSGTVEDVFGIQEEIARKIVAALEVRLRSRDKRGRRAADRERRRIRLLSARAPGDGCLVAGIARPRGQACRPRIEHRRRKSIAPRDEGADPLHRERSLLGQGPHAHCQRRVGLEQDQ
jgi:TolB-like protein